ncbi:hypothetical protein AB0H83_35170 [Dactylosporangium sp. NPDC050688]|uniref:hypothetical protein n=1 Tax=Dactylosporangium sp. NPDC050688 TaxID=3157217 RepID=UPI0033E5C332
MIVNLTPHPLHLYPAGTPDRVEPGTVTCLKVIPPSTQHQPARLTQRVLHEEDLGEDIPVERVAFAPDGDPTSALPGPVPGTWYVVSLVVGLAAADRDDLLVPHEHVRDTTGVIVGSRKLARPHRT